MDNVDEPKADDEGTRKSRTEEAIETVLKGQAALGKGPLAPTKLPKMAPGVTATEQGMRAVLDAEEVLGKGKIR